MLSFQVRRLGYQRRWHRRLSWICLVVVLAGIVAGSPPALAGGPENTPPVSSFHTALEFNGEDAYIDIPDSAPTRLSNSFTIEFWVKSLSVAQPGVYLVARDSGAGSQTSILYNNPAGTVSFYAHTYSGSDPRPGSELSVSDTNWHHVAYTYDGSIWAGYLDGTQVFSTARTFSLNVDPYGWLAGTSALGGSYFYGQMDELRIWNVSRSAAEVQENYLRTLPGNEAGLVAYYRMDEESGYTVIDYSANGQHADRDGDYDAWIDSTIGLDQTTAEDTDLTILLTGYDWDADPLSARISTLPSSGGTLYQYDNGARGDVINSAGTVVEDPLWRVIFAPAADGNGSPHDQFGFILNDGIDDSSEATVTVNVAAVNDAPVVGANAGLTVNEGGSGAITAAELQVTDVDTTPAQVTYTVVTAPANGSLLKSGGVLLAGWTFTQADVDAGSISYAHDGGETTTDSFAFTVSDGAGGSIGSTAFNITVNAVNDAPVLAANAGLTVNEGGSGSITAAKLQVTDADNTAAQLTYTLATAPADGTLYKSGGALTDGGTFTQADVDAGAISYTHNGGETTTDSFAFTVSDGAGGSMGSTAFSITVTAVNDVPTITAIGDETIDEDGATAPLAFTVGDAETASDSLTVSGSSSDTALVPDSGENIIFGGAGADRTVTVLPAEGQSGTATITVTVSDGAASAGTSFTLTVTAVNDAPVLAANAGLTVNEGGSGSITAAKLQVTDADNTAAQLTYTLATAPANGTLLKSGSALAQDGTFTQADVDAGEISYTHNGGETTTDSFTFTVSDGAGGSVGSTAFSITVNAVNDTPVLAANAGLTVDEGGSGSITAAKLQVTDADNTAAQLTYTLATVPANGSLYNSGGALAEGETFTQADVDAGAISYTHNGGETTTDSFAFTVSDGAGGSIGSTAFSITVTAVNDVPTITAIGDETIDEDGATAPLAFTVGDAETAADSLTVSGSSSDTGLVPDSGENIIFGGAGADRTVTVLPAEGQSGTATITVTVSDGAASAGTSFTLTVTAVNDAPVLAANAGLTVNEGGSGSITAAKLQVTDADNTAAQLTYTVATAPANGTLLKSGSALAQDGAFTQADVDAGAISYTHNGGETTTDSFAFTVSDGAGGSIGSTAFSITVTAVNDAPAPPVFVSPAADSRHVDTVALAAVTMDAEGNDYHVTFEVHGNSSFSDPQQILTGTTVASGAESTVTWPVELPAGTYYLRARATDSVGADSGYTELGAITVGRSPNAATSLNPSGGNWVTTTTPDLTWSFSSRDSTATQGAFQVYLKNPEGTTVSDSGKTNGEVGSYTVPDATLTESTFSWSVRTWDNHGNPGGYAAEATFRVDTVPPVVAALAPLTVKFTSSAVIKPENLQVTDAQSTAGQLVYTLTGVPVKGTLMKQGASLAAGDTFTQADVDDGHIEYRSDTTGTDQVTFSVSDLAGNTREVQVPVTISEPLSGNARLKSLEISPGSLAPAFSPDITSYRATVPHDTRSVDVQGSPEEPGATVTVGGNTGNLEIGPNTVVVKVRAPNGLIRTYTITVNRAAPPLLQTLEVDPGEVQPVFAATVDSYTVEVKNEVGSLTLTAVPVDPADSVTVNGNPVDAEASTLDLKLGDNVFTLVVADEDQVARTTYTLTVRRAQVKELFLDSAGYRLTPGGTHETVVTARYTDGTEGIVEKQGIPGFPVEYAAEDPAVARLDQTGLVTGLAYGRTKVSVTYQEQQAEAQIAIVADGTVAVGSGHTLVVREEGVIQAWGLNQNGQVGDSTTVDRSTPVTVQGIVGATYVSAGGQHSLAAADGLLWTWGANGSGQLGDGTTTDNPTPRANRDLFGVSAVAAGREHSLALLSDGSVWTWGANGHGQLGDGSVQDRFVPQPVDGLSNVVSVAAGEHHSLALTADGTVWAWGANDSGQLGDGTVTDRSTPVPVQGLPKVVVVATGQDHSLALAEDGSVWSWGSNTSGQLGNAATGRQPTAQQVPELTDVVSLAAGGEHSLAVLADGSVMGWGSDSHGQLGADLDPITANPVQIPGLDRVVAVVAGSRHSVALRSDGGLLVWGYGGDYQAGNGSSSPVSEPDEVDLPPVDKEAAEYEESPPESEVGMIIVGSNGQNPGGQNPGGQNPGGQNPGGQNPGGQNPGGQNPGGQDPGEQDPGEQNPGEQNPGEQNPEQQDPEQQDPEEQNPGEQDPGTKFTDLTGHWAEQSILELVATGVITGFPDQTFRPEAPVSRLQFAVMLARILGADTTSGQDEESGFSDGDQIPAWAAASVAEMARLGLVSGYPDGSFRPDDTVSRAELAALVTRVFQYLGADPTVAELVFTDLDDLPEWSLPSIRSAVGAGLLSGYPDGSFRASDPASRAQSAVILRRLQVLVGPVD